MITDSIAFIQALIYSFYLKKKKKKEAVLVGVSAKYV